jgi:hypothetical protein
MESALELTKVRDKPRPSGRGGITRAAAGQPLGAREQQYLTAR